MRYSQTMWPATAPADTASLGRVAKALVAANVARPMIVTVTPSRTR
jgi:hypothetical protein